MSYQGYACDAWVTNWDFIKSIAPKEASDFEKVCNGELEQIAFDVSCCDEIEDEVSIAINALAYAFNRETGLTIGLGYISYDEVDSDEHGAIWYVGGVQEYTPAGRKYLDHLNQLQWVEYG